MGNILTKRRRRGSQKAATPVVTWPNFLGHYELEKQLGRGKFGVVWKALDTVSKEIVAIKCLRRGPSLGSDYVIQEVRNHQQLRHPHIIQFKKVFLAQSHLCIVMEYGGSSNLHEYIEKSGPLREDLARWIFQQLLLAVDYCHKKSIAIRDIKPANLIMNGLYIKLCDLGFSKHLEQGNPPTSLVGTIPFLAPEVLSAKYEPRREYDAKKADVWACGATLRYMLAGHLRPENPRKGTDIQFPMSSDCHDLLSRMMNLEPGTRFSVAEVMNHKWFRKNLPKNFTENNDRQLLEEEHRLTSKRSYTRLVELAGTLVDVGECWSLRKRKSSLKCLLSSLSEFDL